MAASTQETKRAFDKKEQGRKLAREQNATIRERIDEKTGKVKVFLFAKATWIALWPIDAKEYIKRGWAALQVIQLVNPQSGKAEYVDALCVEQLLAKGWKDPIPVVPVVEPIPTADLRTPPSGKGKGKTAEPDVEPPK